MVNWMVPKLFTNVFLEELAGHILAQTGHQLSLLGLLAKIKV